MRRSVMPESVDAAGVERLMAEGGQLVEVLAPEEFAEEHLPGAHNIPLKELGAHSAARLDRARPVVVYCWDAL
jgi:rhodanese-related sulfurtransferase